MYRVIIADNSDLSRIGLKAIFKQNKEIKIIGEAKRNQELVELVLKSKPDVVIIDYTANNFNIYSC